MEKYWESTWSCEANIQLVTTPLSVVKVVAFAAN